MIKSDKKTLPSHKVSEFEIAVLDRPSLPDAAPGATIVRMNPKRTSRAVAVVCSVLIGLMGAACAGQPEEARNFSNLLYLYEPYSISL